MTDLSRQPHASINRANQLGVEARRLPIAEYAVVSRTDFFTISDVLKIISSYAESADWARVFSSLSAAQRNARRTVCVVALDCDANVGCRVLLLRLSGRRRRME